MYILIVTVSLPYPPASGGALRVYGMIKGLAEAGHTVDLIAFGDEIPAANSPLRQHCRHIETLPTPQHLRWQRLQTLLFSLQADIAKRFYDQEFEACLLHLIAQHDYDLVQFEAIESACYLPIVRAHYPDTPICFDTFNAEADLQRTIFQIDRSQVSRWPMALYSYVQSRRIERYEGDLCRMADLVIAVSDEDKAILSRYRADDQTYIVPSGILVSDYAKTQQQVRLSPRALVFTGKMDYRPNVDAMLWFTQDVLSQVNNAHLTIVGQKPHARLQHLAEQPNITLTGWVDSVLPYLHSADVYIAPLRMGSGTRLKILEAMAAGCAIVATSIAAAGLSDEIRSALMIADDAGTFAQAINSLLDDPGQRDELGQRAQMLVKQHYDWSVLIPRLLQAYREADFG